MTLGELLSACEERLKILDKQLTAAIEKSLTAQKEGNLGVAAKEMKRANLVRLQIIGTEGYMRALTLSPDNWIEVDRTRFGLPEWKCRQTVRSSITEAVGFRARGSHAAMP